MFSLEIAELSLVALAILGGGILRGMSGFGFSMTMIVMLTLFMPPAVATAYILLWEIMASITHLPFVWRQVDWRTLKWLCVGVIFGTPLGIMLLVIIAPNPMTVAINCTVILLCIIMLKGFYITRQLKPTEVIGAGIISGIINGASANGGPPAILLFFANPAGASVGRASLIAYFLVTDVWASIIFASQGMMTLQTVIEATAFLPLLAFSIWLGTKLFHRLDENRFKRIAITLLILMSVTGTLRIFFA